MRERLLHLAIALLLIAAAVFFAWGLSDMIEGH